MGKVTGFLEYDRKAFGYKAVETRINNWDEFSISLPEDEIKKQGARCMDCGVPFCHDGCPLGNIIPDFNDLVYKGKWKKALGRLLSTNNFPEFTGKICPAPCESACVLGINKPPVTIKNIEVEIIDRAYKEGWIVANPPKSRTGKKVAIIGSGPAGLAAADQLNKAGHWVTVYERDNRIGGLLRYGIPDFKLDKKLVERRVNLMKEEGIVFEINAYVGKNISISKINVEVDALILAGGSTIPRDLPVPGRNDTNVYFAMDFLKQSNKRNAGDEIPKDEVLWVEGKDVVVIGGGDTGSDCVGTSIRQKAKSITQIELLSMPPIDRNEETPWPSHARLFKLTSSQEEGAKLDYEVLTKGFNVDENGGLKSLQCSRIEWINTDKGKVFKELKESDFEIKADYVFIAMGFLHPEHEGMLKELGVELDKKGNVKADIKNYQTSKEKVFVAGDMRRGQSLVVWAISEGRDCARSVDKYLSGGKTSLFSKKETALSNI
ncbi:MAG: glutamate synthase subunit beta [Gammaproteobacteria bacterium]|nr:glutamate synthase subunit beta [Gammaproteobacteria bacterium]